MVVVHQPLAVTEARDRPNLLRGHTEARRAWADAGADLLIGGHIHLPYTVALQDGERRAWVVQAGTAVSSRTRPGVPNSVNIVRWSAPPADAAAAQRVCLIEQWDWSAHQRAFGCAAVTTVQPQRPLPAG